jgi:hypothetical protein
MNDSPPPDALLIGGPLSRLSISLRIASDVLEPDILSRILGVSPKFAARKGETREQGGRTVTQRVGIWTYGITEEPSEDWELDDAIAALLSRLPTDLAVWRELAGTHHLDIFCGLFMGADNQGAAVRPETLRLLADRGLMLSLDIYGPPPDDEAT